METNLKPACWLEAAQPGALEESLLVPLPAALSSKLEQSQVYLWHLWASAGESGVLGRRRRHWLPTPLPQVRGAQLVQCLLKEAMEVPLIITVVIIGSLLLPIVFKRLGASLPRTSHLP